MKRNIIISFIFLSFCAFGCSHNMRITNLEDHFNAPASPPKETMRVGVVSGDGRDMQKSRYISCIVNSLKTSGAFERVIYPYNHSKHNDVVDVIVNLSVSPSYVGSGSNFFVNWPGFLIFAPAIWGYGYKADIETMANISYSDNGNSQTISIPTKYTFRQAEFDRTWTELGWLEVGIIPLIGGFVFIQYDPDVTDEFITKVSHSYGTCVANKILEAIYVN